jgi:hypothetical protein
VLPFGLGDGAPEPRVAELEPDDAVLLYTDGVTEARTADGEQFGLDRLIDLLEREAASGRTAEELLRRLVRAVCSRTTARTGIALRRGTIEPGRTARREPSTSGATPRSFSVPGL